MYTAVVLDEESRRNLTDLVSRTQAPSERGFKFQTDRGDPLPHHFTLNMGYLDREINDVAVLDSPAEFVIDALCICEELGACAGRVVRAVARPDEREFDLRSTNAHPHVTMCLKPGSRPVNSNRLPWACEENLLILKEPVVVRGTVRVCQ